jgi:competence protein ComEC
MGGMPAVLRNFRPRELWVGIDPGSELYKALLVEAAQLHVVVRHLHAGERFAWGASTISVLAPSASYNNALSPKNDDSVVLEIGFGKAAVLLEGDAERASEEAMLAAHRVLPATLLKVGHHGSMTSTSPDFLAAVAPRDAVISVGRENTYGHPREEIVERIQATGAVVFRTDRDGLTTFLLSRDGAIEAHPSPP